MSSYKTTTEQANISRSLNVFSPCVCTHLHSCCTRDDLDEFTRDDSLSGAVVGQGELVNHLTYKDSTRHGGDSGDVTVTDDELDNHMTVSDKAVTLR